MRKHQEFSSWSEHAHESFQDIQLCQKCALDERLRRLTATLGDRDLELLQQRTILDAAHRETERVRQEAAQERNHLLKQLRDKDANLESMNAALEVERKRVNSLEDNMGSQSRNIDHRMNELSSKLHVLTCELDDSRRACDEANIELHDALVQIDNLKIIKEESEAQMHQLEEANAALREALEAARRAGPAQAGLARDRSAELLRELDALRLQHKNEVLALSQQVEMALHDLDQSKRENQTLRLKLAEEAQCRGEMAAQNSMLLREKERYMTSNEKLREEVASVREARTHIVFPRQTQPVILPSNGYSYAPHRPPSPPTLSSPARPPKAPTSPRQLSRYEAVLFENRESPQSSASSHRGVQDNLVTSEILLERDRQNKIATYKTEQVATYRSEQVSTKSSQAHILDAQVQGAEQGQDPRYSRSPARSPPISPPQSPPQSPARSPYRSSPARSPPRSQRRHSSARKADENPKRRDSSSGFYTNRPSSHRTRRLSHDESDSRKFTPDLASRNDPTSQDERASGNTTPGFRSSRRPSRSQDDEDGTPGSGSSRRSSLRDDAGPVRCPACGIYGHHAPGCSSQRAHLIKALGVVETPVRGLVKRDSGKREQHRKDRDPYRDLEPSSSSPRSGGEDRESSARRALHTEDDHSKGSTENATQGEKGQGGSRRRKSLLLDKRGFKMPSGPILSEEALSDASLDRIMKGGKGKKEDKGRKRDAGRIEQKDGSGNDRGPGASSDDEF